MKKLFLLFLTMAFAISINSCKKYEYGPGISFYSPKARLVNTWNINSKFINRTQQSSDTTWTDEYIQFLANGEIISNANSMYINSNCQWILDSDGTKITISNVVSGFSLTYKILKLSRKELWLQYQLDTGGNIPTSYEIHFGI